MAAPQGHVHLSVDICKGCGLCTVACPFGVLALTGTIVNLKGYQPPSLVKKEKCTGCGNCAGRSRIFRRGAALSGSPPLAACWTT